MSTQLHPKGARSALSGSSPKACFAWRPSAARPWAAPGCRQQTQDESAAPDALDGRVAEIGFHGGEAWAGPGAHPDPDFLSVLSEMSRSVTPEYMSQYMPV